MRRDLPIAALPPRWHGKTLVQISDIHVGYRVSDAFLLDAFARVAELKPDIVAVTGDFLTLDPGGRAPLEQVERVCRHLPRGTAGTLAILGNHDYGRHWAEPAVADQVVDIARNCGMHMLRNETAEFDGLEIVGLDDLWSGRCNIAGGLATSNADAAHIVLSHNPDAVDLPGWGDYRGWILCGHTHGGQCKPPFLPPPFVSVQNRRYIAGHVDLYDGRQLYINRALGHSVRAPVQRPSRDHAAAAGASLTCFRPETDTACGIRSAAACSPPRCR